MSGRSGRSGVLDAFPSFGQHRSVAVSEPVEIPQVRSHPTAVVGFEGDLDPEHLATGRLIREQGTQLL